MISRGKTKVLILTGLFLAISLSVIAVIAQSIEQPDGVPVLPGVYYGSVKVGNKDVVDGLKIEARVNGENCGQKSETKDGKYLLVIRGDDELTPGCADENDNVNIFVNGIEFDTVNWKSGSFRENDLKAEPSDVKGRITEFILEDKKAEKTATENEIELLNQKKIIVEEQSAAEPVIADVSEPVIVEDNSNDKESMEI